MLVPGNLHLSSSLPIYHNTKADYSDRWEFTALKLCAVILES